MHILRAEIFIYNLKMKYSMDKKRYESFLNIIIWLSVIGVITSLYLVKNHYAPPTAGALCDFGESISCSLVNTSVFSELLNVPVALLGVIWFLFLIWMCRKAQKQPEQIPSILGWNVLGILFVIYLVIAEIILQSICPFCTLLHIIIIIILSLSYYLYKHQNPKPHHKDVQKTIKSWIIWSIVIYGLIFLTFILWPSENGNNDTLTQCMTEKGVVMYSSFRCGVCARTKAMLGSSFKYVNEIECHPQGPNAQTELCVAKNIEGTPTWAINDANGNEIKRNTGFLSIEQLREFSGCTQ